MELLNDTERVGNDNTYTFKRENGCWRLLLPHDIKMPASGLEVLKGEGRLLKILAKGTNECRLQLSLDKLENAYLLELMEINAGGSGKYLLRSSDKQHGRSFWICDMALLIFGDIPQKMYIRRMPLSY